MKYSLRFSIRNFFLREISFLGRQRFMTLLFYEAVLTVGLSFKLFGLTGITKPWFFTINALFLGVVLILFLLYNSSLKFEIKAKQFYAASQRVL